VQKIFLHVGFFKKSLGSRLQNPAFDTFIRPSCDHDHFCVRIQLNNFLKDSLAYAYRQAGNKDKAIENYRNELERDPKLVSALKGLEALEGKKSE